MFKILNPKALALLLSLLIAAPSFAQSSMSDEDSVENEIDEQDPAALEKPQTQLPKGEAAPAEISPVDLTPTEPAELTPAQVAPPEHAQPKPDTPRDAEEQKASSESGEKIFDWSKYKNAREVPHPFAEKGLIRITKEGDYIYKVDETPQSRAADFRIGIFNPQNLENPDAAGQRGSTFDENYDQTSNPAMMFDYEWQLWRMPIGKIGLRAGTGVFIAQGNGHFVHPDLNPGLTPKEVFTFWAMPNSVGAVYRVQVWDRQLLVPYVEGGGIAFAFGEFRDDSKPPKWGGALASYYAGGLAVNLTYFDNSSRLQLDREYGINRVYLTMEFRGIITITQNYDFSSNLVNGGLLMEF